MTPFPSCWEDLLKEAYSIIDAVNRDGDILGCWTFGGGTAMMLQIDHRESHDVDLFLDDPQLLPYVEATVAEMQFEIGTGVGKSWGSSSCPSVWAGQSSIENGGSYDSDAVRALG